MLKSIIIFVIFFINVTYGYADLDRKNTTNNKPKILKEIKTKFDNKKSELVKEFRDGKISLKEAKAKLLEERQIYEQEAKAKLIEEREKSNNKKLEILKSKIEMKLKSRFENIDKLDSENSLKIYENILSKIENLLDNENISNKKKLLYNILKDIFTEKIDEIKN